MKQDFSITGEKGIKNTSTPLNSTLSREWFGEWFDSPYYHILYKNRNFEEASAFVNKLAKHLQLNSSHSILDLACGKGRHAIHLNQMGLDVIGIDLSSENIKAANAFSNPRLKFFQHDMRQAFRTEYFDYILNMFTSFGYFEKEEENQKAISVAAEGLKKEGKLIIDFLNPDFVRDQMIEKEKKVIEGITFHITKEIDLDNFILKTIKFNDRGQNFRFQEKVKAISQDKFISYFEKAGLKLEALFGDYQLGPFNPNSSERMIFIAKKP
ncbi:class I SAM-dependent methyltransferase [Cytophagales bacterium RKSG123]|nr:class I SAM-dependent methyltransferase [Xanthovirga aplysinae]